jgi:hypothetical protein
MLFTYTLTCKRYLFYLQQEATTSVAKQRRVLKEEEERRKQECRKQMNELEKRQKLEKQMLRAQMMQQQIKIGIKESGKEQLGFVMEGAKQIVSWEENEDEVKDVFIADAEDEDDDDDWDGEGATSVVGFGENNEEDVEFPKDK